MKKKMYHINRVSSRFPSEDFFSYPALIVQPFICLSWQASLEHATHFCKGVKPILPKILKLPIHTHASLTCVQRMWQLFQGRLAWTAHLKVCWWPYPIPSNKTREEGLREMCLHTHVLRDSPCSFLPEWFKNPIPCWPAVRILPACCCCFCCVAQGIGSGH